MVVLAVASLGAFADADEDQWIKKRWIESSLEIPATTALTQPIELDPGPTTRARFFIDLATLSVGGDGVVRYVMQVRTQGGALNTTFEGIRCSARERRIYATARRDGTWTIVRGDDWSRIEFRTINAFDHQLYKHYFCPQGVIVRDKQEAVMALQSGGHPEAKVSY